MKIKQCSSFEPFNSAKLFKNDRVSLFHSEMTAVLDTIAVSGATHVCFPAARLAVGEASSHSSLEDGLHQWSRCKPGRTYPVSVFCVGKRKPNKT